jgi:hypothetical protein
MACKVTYVSGSLAFKTPYNRYFVADLKDLLPQHARKWNNKSEVPPEVWLIDPQYGSDVIMLIQRHYGETLTLPSLQYSKPQVENRMFKVRYVGGVKTRNDGQKLAYGLVGDTWSLIFSEEVLKDWFEGLDIEDGGSKGTLFSILGLPSINVTDDEIKKAYRRMAMQWHPDQCHEPNATEKFQEIQAAYEILRDPRERKLYSAGLFFSEHKEERISGRRSSYDWDDYKPPLRCGQIKTRGYFVTGRFVVEEIVAWEDITDNYGRTLVTSWSMSVNNGKGGIIEEWVR